MSAISEYTPHCIPVSVVKYDGPHHAGVHQIKRLYRAYKAVGAKGLISARRGKPSNHRLEAQVEQQTLDLLKAKYADFGPTLAHEKLTEVHHLRLSRESVQRIMIEEGLWKPRRAKQPSAHQMRERRACHARA